MTQTIVRRSEPHDTAAWRDGQWLWIGLLMAASVAFSLTFACATPFAALAALAALDMERRDGLTLILAIWLSNQIVGYGLLGYPHEPQSYAWGVALGLAATVAFLLARLFVERPSRAGPLTVMGGALGVSFVAYEAVLLAASLVLPSSDAAVSGAVVGRIAAVNAASFAGLLLLHRGAYAIGLVRHCWAERLALTGAR